MGISIAGDRWRRRKTGGAVAGAGLSHAEKLMLGSSAKTGMSWYIRKTGRCGIGWRGDIRQKENARRRRTTGAVKKADDAWHHRRRSIWRAINNESVGGGRLRIAGVNAAGVQAFKCLPCGVDDHRRASGGHVSGRLWRRGDPPVTPLGDY